MMNSKKSILGTENLELPGKRKMGSASLQQTAGGMISLGYQSDWTLKFFV